ncbi:hypothetical protein KW787_00905 [Candidatus Pacearchaeota archaeon]|nr:hypothetical protein [Candidatus Pacearchaeota archaeon]
MRKNFVVIVLAIFLILSCFFVSADITVETKNVAPVIISDLNNPAVFNFTIFNHGETQGVQLYSLLGVSMTPKGNFDIQPGENKIEVRAYLPPEMRKNPGFFTFTYELKGSDSGIYKGALNVEIVELKSTMAISADNFKPGDSQAIVRVKNLKNTYLENVNVKFSSALFSGEKTVSLKPGEETSFNVSVDLNSIKKLVAGPYVIKTEISVDDKKAKIEGVVNYLEREGISVNSHTTGFIVRETTVTKVNEGNKPTSAKIDMRKDIVSRLFTSYSIQPLVVQRSGLLVDYAWEKQLAPAEELAVTSTTNYTLPFVLIILVGISVVVARTYVRTALTVSKKVSFVKTKGGEFALKVTLHVHAGSPVEEIQVHDHLPGSAVLYEKFGSKPDSINGRTLGWTIHRLNRGEERTISYIIYSKLRIVGAYELPSAKATFKHNGQENTVFSNRAFFVSETARSED